VMITVTKESSLPDGLKMVSANGLGEIYEHTEGSIK
jgi:hypothetical protein